MWFFITSLWEVGGTWKVVIIYKGTVYAHLLTEPQQTNRNIFSNTNGVIRLVLLCLQHARINSNSSLVLYRYDAYKVGELSYILYCTLLYYTVLYCTVLYKSWHSYVAHRMAEIGWKESAQSKVISLTSSSGSNILEAFYFLWLSLSWQMRLALRSGLY